MTIHNCFIHTVAKTYHGLVGWPENSLPPNNELLWGWGKLYITHHSVIKIDAACRYSGNWSLANNSTVYDRRWVDLNNRVSYSPEVTVSAKCQVIIESGRMKWIYRWPDNRYPAGVYCLVLVGLLEFLTDIAVIQYSFVDVLCDYVLF